MKFKEIIFEPPYKSFFLVDEEGKLVFAGSDEIAYRMLVESGFNPEDAREAVLYARSTLGQWISLDKFRPERKTVYTRAGMYVKAITADEIRNLVRRGPDFRGEKNADALRGLLRDIDTVVGAIRSTWTNSKRRIEAAIPRMNAEEISDFVDLLNGTLDFLTAVNRYLGSV